MFTAIKNPIRRLFGKEPEPQARPAQRKGGKHLSHEDRRQIEAAIAKAKGKDKTELSAQDSIPYQRMFPDGICRVTDTFYTKTVQFQDINYQLSQNEDKTAMCRQYGTAVQLGTGRVAGDQETVGADPSPGAGIYEGPGA